MAFSRPGSLKSKSLLKPNTPKGTTALALSKDELQSTREAQQKNAFLLQENVTLTTSLSTKNKEIENLNTRLIALELKLEAEKKQSAELQEKDKQSKHILDEASLHLETITQTNKQQQIKIAELETSIKQYEQSSEKMKMKLADLETEKAALTKQITEQQSKIAEYEAQSKLNTLQHEESQKKIAQLENDLQTKIVEQQTITSVRHESEAKNSERIEALKNAVAQANKTTHDRDTTIARLLNENKTLRNQTISFQNSLKTATDQSKQKNHWGWYALGVVGVLVGLALTATGFGAVAGAPLALTIVGGMFGTALTTSFSAIMAGLATSIVGLGASIANAIYINRKVKHDKVCDEAIDLCTAKTKEPIASAPVMTIPTSVVTTSSAGQSTQSKLVGRELGRLGEQSPLPATRENVNATKALITSAATDALHFAVINRRGTLFGPETTDTSAAPAASASTSSSNQENATASANASTHK